MEQIPETTKATRFESLLNKLQREMDGASELAYDLEKKAELLSPIIDNQGKDEGKSSEPQGYLSRLEHLISRLSEINVQNDKSLKHLSELV